CWPAGRPTRGPRIPACGAPAAPPRPRRRRLSYSAPVPIVRLEWYDLNGSDRRVRWASMSIGRLTPASYVVLGLVEGWQPATPYELKRAAELGVVNLWSVPHTQLYTEPARL